MKTLTFLLAVAFCGSLCPILLADEPVFDSIDYASPETYLVIADSLGDHDAIAKQAHGLKADDDRQTLANILRWMETQLKYDGDRAYQWRNFDTVVSQRCYGGCADQAIVCGVLLQSAGIPTVWVKTMDVDWIWDFKKKRPFKSWSGHVFLEIYLEGKWVLLDPGASKIYVDYSPQSRILPGNRFAYHKGNDPKRMVMSLQWEDWKCQTTSFFNEFDESLLPVDTKSVLDVRPRCFIIANSPYYQFFGELVRQNGGAVGRSFNTDYEQYLPEAKGNLILVETHDGAPIVDMAILQRHFPAVPDGKQAGRVIDGDTTIVFVDVAMIADQIAAVASEPSDARETSAESDPEIKLYSSVPVIVDVRNGHNDEHDKDEQDYGRELRVCESLCSIASHSGLSTGRGGRVARVSIKGDLNVDNEVTYTNAHIEVMGSVNLYRNGCLTLDGCIIEIVGDYARQYGYNWQGGTLVTRNTTIGGTMRNGVAQQVNFHLNDGLWTAEDTTVQYTYGIMFSPETVGRLRHASEERAQSRLDHHGWEGRRRTVRQHLHDCPEPAHARRQGDLGPSQRCSHHPHV